MNQQFFKNTPTSYIAFFASIVLLFLATMHSEIATGKEVNVEKYMKLLDRKTDKKRESIRNTKTNIEVRGTKYYVAQDGNDQNDGLSPATPIKSIDKVNSLPLKAGDAVLFKRGDLWRGHITSCYGVTYSAYGKGPKPTIYGSPYDAATTGVWRETEAKNVYVYDQELPDDIGTLVFNHGEGCAFKVMKVHQADGSTLHIDTNEPFADYRDLKRDLDFYHDYRGTKRVYLYSEKGNPAKRFNSIELLTKGHIIKGSGNIVVDNLCLKYCGSHGIGFGTIDSLTVTNCA